MDAYCFIILQKKTIFSITGSAAVDTARRIIRRLMSKQLAVQFSLTGLGEKRKATKISFRDHAVAVPVIGNILYKLSKAVYVTFCVVR